MKFQGKLTFTYALAVKSGKLKSAKENQGTRHFENIIYRVLNERSDNTASFEEHLKFQKKLNFAYALWIYCSQLKKN